MLSKAHSYRWFFLSLLNTSAILGSIMALLDLCLLVYLNVGLLGHTYSSRTAKARVADQYMAAFLDVLGRGLII